VTGTSSSGNYTFSHANLPNLEVLNLSNASFACENMKSNDDSNDIATGLCTFEYMNLPKLTTLNLSGTSFAKDDMAKTS
jgi:hypothetical protein